jgi:hypothetical protein
LRTDASSSTIAMRAAGVAMSHVVEQLRAGVELAEGPIGVRVPQRMSRKSGYRFSEKDMRKRRNLECVPVHLNRDAL